jgi:hypothetical protein
LWADSSRLSHLSISQIYEGIINKFAAFATFESKNGVSKEIGFSRKPTLQSYDSRLAATLSKNVFSNIKQFYREYRDETRRCGMKDPP